MRNAIFLLLLVCVSHYSLAQTKKAEKDDLEKSQFCTKAASEFRKQPEWREASKLHMSVSFTSHFNKTLNKCLVKVSSSDLIEKTSRVMETNHIYDALENTVLGGKILLKVRDGNDYKVETITMVRDGKVLGKNNPDAASEAYQWFDTLMKE